jgi:hypothetical protein
VRKALFGLLVAAANCSDFTLVGPESAPQPPQASVFLTVDRFDSSRYVMSAFFFRGVDSRGHLGELADRVFYVDDRPLQPRTNTGSEFWDYNWEETRADGGVHADSLRIRPPVLVLAGSPIPGVTVTIPITGREGLADVTWAEGEDLRLRVSPPIGATPQLAGGPTYWTLELGDACGGGGASTSRTVQGRGAYPPEFRVPWEWLLSAAPTPAVACVRVLFDYQVSNAPYRLDVVVDLRLTWRIHMTGTS